MSSDEITESFNYKIVKDNKIINARESFTLLQQRIILLMCARIGYDDTEMNEYHVPIREVLGIPEGKPIGGGYDRVRKAAQGLAHSAIDIEEGDRWASYSFVTVAKGEKGKDFVTIKFSQEMKPFFLKLKSNYTYYLLKHVYNFSRSRFSLRIYELLIQYFPRIPKRTFKLEKLKDLLYVKGSYSRFSAFRTKVLEPAISEINEKSDIFVTYEFKREKRKYTDITFFVVKGEHYKAQEDGNKVEIPEKLSSESQTEKTATKKASAEKTQKNKVSESQTSIDFNQKQPEVSQAKKPHENQKRQHESQAPQAEKVGNDWLAPTLFSGMVQKYGEGLVRYTIDRINEKPNVKSKLGYLNKALLEGYYRNEYEDFARKDQLKRAMDRKKTLEEQRKSIESEFHEHYENAKISILKEHDTEDERFEYMSLVEFTDEYTFERRYLEEWRKSSPSEEARKFYGKWLLKKYGTKEDHDLKAFALTVHDFKNWK
ncbi:hypothetical protein FUAX_43880 (plasmid) [Fulvitalea axinellae]|uniref:Initiator Rep protein WH1 domain-containing protein n=1 Tax=Fulvitalea axinellae TaxID=1182444 RepID=A0AAU9CS49_9BACT|nr:hypothetical protein FUAX_43880 [Fulvitalea axinellae]